MGVHADVRLDVEAEPLDVGGERSHVRQANGLHGNARVVHVRIHDDLLLRQVGDDHRLRVRVALHGIEVERSRAVAQHVLLVHGLDRRRPPAGREHRVVRGQPVRLEAALARMQQHVLVELAVALVSDDRRALRQIRSQAAGVIEMMVRVDYVADRLVRHEAADFLDDGQRAGLVERRFHDRDKVLELDEHAVMRSAGDAPDAIGERLGFCDDVGHARIADVGRHLDRRQIGIDPHVAHAHLHRVVRGIQDGIALMLVPDRRQHDAVEFLVVEVTHLEQHVSVDGFRDPGRHELDEISIVDRAIDTIFVERRERHDRDGLTALREAVVRGPRDRDRDRGRIVGFERGFQEAVRRQHHIEPAKVRMGDAVDVAARLRDGSIVLHVPGVLAAQRAPRCAGRPRTARRRRERDSCPAGARAPRVRSPRRSPIERVYSTISNRGQSPSST